MLFWTRFIGRIRTAEQWWRKEEQQRDARGGSLWDRLQPDELQSHTILKLSEDQRRGKS